MWGGGLGLIGPAIKRTFFCGFPYVYAKSFNFDADFFKANLALIKKTVEGVEVKYYILTFSDPI